ncbi:MAG: TRAP transporter substrate-binding protein DctP [Chloroflexota bacterium]
MKARFCLGLLVLFLLLTVLPACAAKPEATQKVHWDMAVSGTPRVLTYPFEDFAADMAKLTNGLWEIKVHYGEVLSPYANHPDGIKQGLFEMCQMFASVHPGKTPLQTVIELPFLGPGDLAQLAEWMDAIYRHPALVKELDQWNGMYFFPNNLASYEYMGKKPFKTVEDLKGLRIRVSATMGMPFTPFGAVLEMMPGGEVYTALERGMIDGVVWVWTYTFGSYKLYELSKYATTEIAAGAAGMMTVVNKDAWNALPEEWRKMATNWAQTNASQLYIKYNALADAQWLPLFAKAGIEITQLPPAERAKLVERAKPSWEEWVKRMEAQKLPGREVLDFAIAKKAEIEAKYKKK